MKKKGIATLSVLLSLAACSPSNQPAAQNPTQQIAAAGACQSHTFPATHNDNRSDIDNAIIDKTAEYRITMDIGTPAQKVLVVPDTGSSNLNIRQVGCVGCTGNTFYDPSKSTTAKKGSGSNFSIGYGSGNATLSPYTDSIGFNCGGAISQAQFGVITSAKGVPNVLGLAAKGLAQGGITPFLEQYYQKFSTFQNLFTMTLCGVSGNSGIFFGALDHRVAANQYQYTKRAPGDYFNILPTGVKMPDGKLVAFSANSNIIVDSGTTMSNLDPTIVSAMQQAIAATPGLTGLPANFWSNPGSSMPAANIAPSVIAAMPSFNLVLPDGKGGSINVLWTSRAYMKNWGSNSYSFGLQPSAENAQFMILGQTFMDDKSTVFNVAAGTIGFAPNAQACSQPIAAPAA